MNKNGKNMLLDLIIDHPDIINEGVLEDENKIKELGVYQDTINTVNGLVNQKDLTHSINFTDKAEGAGAAMPQIVIDFLSGKAPTALSNLAGILELAKLILEILKKLHKKYSNHIEIGIKSAEVIAKAEIIKKKAVIGIPKTSFKRQCGKISNNGFKFKTEYLFIINGNYLNKHIFLDSTFVSVGNRGEIKHFYKF